MPAHSHPIGPGGQGQGPPEHGHHVLCPDHFRHCLPEQDGTAGAVKARLPHGGWGEELWAHTPPCFVVT